MATITLYMRQQKRHWCIEQSFGLRGRGRGWDDLGEWHWNMYNIIYETSRQPRFDARYWMLGAGTLGRPRGMVPGGRREEDSGWGTRVYLWWIHVDIWQNQYNIAKLKNKKKETNKKDVHVTYLLISKGSVTEALLIDTWSFWKETAKCGDLWHRQASIFLAQKGRGDSLPIS